MSVLPAMGTAPTSAWLCQLEVLFVDALPTTHLMLTTGLVVVSCISPQSKLEFEKKEHFVVHVLSRVKSCQSPELIICLTKEKD